MTRLYRTRDRLRRSATARKASISSLGAQLGLTPRAMRYYEQIGLLTVARDRSNRRVYDEQARERLQIIAELRRIDLPLDLIAELLGHKPCGDAQLAAEVARHLRAAIARLDERRAVLAHSLELYEARARAGGREAQEGAADAPRRAGGRS